MADLSGKNILMVIAPKDFQDTEYSTPKQIFENNNAKVTTASTVETATSASGREQSVDILLDKATTDYDAIVFVGGSGASVYFDNTAAQNLAKSFNEQGKVVAAICIAPSILANAGILAGKKATVFPTEESNLKEKGANYTAEAVTVDGKIITAKDPTAAEEFANKIIENL